MSTLLLKVERGFWQQEQLLLGAVQEAEVRLQWITS